MKRLLIMLLLLTLAFSGCTNFASTNKTDVDAVSSSKEKFFPEGLYYSAELFCEYASIKYRMTHNASYAIEGGYDALLKIEGIEKYITTEKFNLTHLRIADDNMEGKIPYNTVFLADKG